MAIRLSALCGAPTGNVLGARLTTNCRVIAGDSLLETKTTSSNVVPDAPLVAQSKLLRKLSDANLSNRQLRRQVQANNDAIVNLRQQLVALEREVEALARVAQEVAGAGVLPGTRKINGRYLHSHLAFKLEEIRGRLKSRIDEVHNVSDVELEWIGMAESVQIMGSFDGWTVGVDMSAEVTEGFTRFSGCLKLPPGRYEVKFLVDGEWQLSPALPSVGEGLACNNLLVVE